MGVAGAEKKNTTKIVNTPKNIKKIICTNSHILELYRSSFLGKKQMGLTGLRDMGQAQISKYPI